MNIKKLDIKDIASIFNFRLWLRDATKKFHGENISDKTILIILDSIREDIISSKSIKEKNKSTWLKEINNLRNKCE